MFSSRLKLWLLLISVIVIDILVIAFFIENIQTRNEFGALAQALITIICGLINYAITAVLCFVFHKKSFNFYFQIIAAIVNLVLTSFFSWYFCY
jgi:hypothetical protein